MDSSNGMATERQSLAPIDRDAEAARSALLRRLAPGLRHQMVVHLQPVEMLVELAKRRLAGEQVDLALIREGVEKIGQYSRAAMGACMGSMGWLSQEDDQIVALDEGVAECVAVLKSSLSFRGFAVHNTVPPMPGALVSRAGVRSLLATTLLALSDSLPAPLELHISARSQQGQAELQVRALPSVAAGSFFGERPARLLTPDDLRALARAHAARVDWQDRHVVLLLPLVEAAGFAP